MALSPYDQSIYDAGFKYVPQSQYLLNPFQIPQGEESEGNVAPGIPAIYQAQNVGGGGGNQNILGSDSRGYMGNYQGMNFNDMYSYTPQGITIEDLSKPSNIGDFSVTTAPDLPNQSGYINPAPEIFEPQQQNMFQKAFGKTLDLGKTIGSGIVSLATGVPFAGQLLEKGLGAISSNFENRPLGAAVIDEFGNVYDEEELNKQNALGGYYTEAARSARRRTNRINAMLQRRAKGLKISEKNLKELQEQEAAQEAARQAAADAMQAENRDRGKGGYQAGYDSGFMEGPSGAGYGMGASDKGGSDTMGSSKDGGIIGYGGKSGTPLYQQFMNGGLANLVDIYD
jgi:hypothetical protein